MDMDMDGMDMGGDGGGHDHNHQNPSINAPLNHALARDYWYIAVAIVGSLLLLRGIDMLETRRRLSHIQGNKKLATRPTTTLTQIHATTTALLRELSHPQSYIAKRGLRWLTPPSLGRIITILLYTAVIATFMTYKAITHDIYFHERLAYRNAWISITQLPMLYLLSMKCNPIGWLTGLSHERINWLHRWVARVMFISATVHGWHFWTQWADADFIEFALEIMPLTKYGFGAWGILLWNVIIGILPLRRLAYEVWVVQHIVGAALMVWLLYEHVPIPARYNLWMAISFWVFDRFARWFILLWQNVQWRPNRSTCQGGKFLGHHISLKAVGEKTTLLTIKNVHIPWEAGQFIYLWIPRIGPVEAHPYTIACARKPASDGGCYCNSVQLIIRAHGGFSKRLHKFAQRHPEKTVTGFLSGPFGNPPKWESMETVVLMGASTGASFTIPILEDIAAKKTETCVRKVEAVLMARTAEEIEYYVARSRDAARKIRDKGMEVKIHVAITGGYATLRKDSSESEKNSIAKSSSETDDALIREKERVTSIEKARSVSVHEDPDVIKPVSTCGKTGGCGCCRNTPRTGEPSSSGDEGAGLVTAYEGRPDIEELIRKPVEAAWGETAVIVCGGKEIVARTRNVVSALSDERGVHKGTGAQGIYLYVEEYSF